MDTLGAMVVPMAAITENTVMKDKILTRSTRSSVPPTLHAGNGNSYGPANYLCPIRCTYRDGIRPFINDVDDRLPDLIRV